jgi:hypothetical protein
MDDTHREFVACVDALLTASDAQIPEALEAFIQHAEAHFKQENEWLAAPDFPAAANATSKNTRKSSTPPTTSAKWSPRATGRRRPGLRPGAGGLVSRARGLHGFGAGSVAGEADAQRAAAGVSEKGDGVGEGAGQRGLAVCFSVSFDLISRIK